MTDGRARTPAAVFYGQLTLPTWEITDTWRRGTGAGAPLGIRRQTEMVT